MLSLWGIWSIGLLLDNKQLRRRHNLRRPEGKEDQGKRREHWKLLVEAKRALRALTNAIDDSTMIGTNADQDSSQRRRSHVQIIGIFIHV